jgi:hypothetical protein
MENLRDDARYRGMLRVHIARLPDFAEFDVFDKALAHAIGFEQKYRALAFFLNWARLDLAAKLVVVRLPWLAPAIPPAIINGRKPPQLTAQTLMRLTPRLPTDWAEQRKLLGFRGEQLVGSVSCRLQSLWLRVRCRLLSPRKK